MIKKIILCLFLLTACKESSIANPWIEYSSISEAEKEASFSLQEIPNEIEGESISYIGFLKEETLWQITYGDNSFVLRKGLGSKDISGDYNDYALKFSKKIQNQKLKIQAINHNKSKDAYNLATWHDQKYAYSIYSENGMSLETIENLLIHMETKSYS